MVCAQCHSFRDIYVDNFAAGDDYYDHFLPVLEYNLPDTADPAYWPDNRPRRFSMDAFGLWESECYLKGKATCVDCHVQAHAPDIDRNPQLRPEANAMCTRCHESIGKSVAAHMHMRLVARAVRAWNATCRERFTASRPRFAITRCRFRFRRTPSVTAFRTPAFLL
jgi:hypothetical protein